MSPFRLALFTVGFSLLIASNECSIKKLKIGLTAPMDSTKLGFRRCMAGANMGIESAKANGFLDGIDIEYYYQDDKCEAKPAVAAVINLHETYDVDAYIGLPCSAGSRDAGKIIAYWDLPFISYSSSDVELADKEIYNTLIRVISPFNLMAKALLEVMDYYHWDRLVIVRGFDADDYCHYAERAVKELFYDQNITIEYNGAIDADVRDSTIDTWLNKIKKQGRVVMLCGSEGLQRRFMLAAQEKGMTDSGEYVYITPGLLPVENMLQRWVRNDPLDEKAMRAFHSLLQMSLAGVNTKEAEEFLKLIPDKMAEPPWNYTGTKDYGLTGSPFALFLHDATHFYAKIVDYMIKKGLDYRNGTAMFLLAKDNTTNFEFDGKSGRVVMDSNNDRLGDYTIYHLAQNGHQYEPLLLIKMTESPPRIEVKSQRLWGGNGIPPKDTPVCGFYGEFCQDSSTRDTILIAVAALGILIAACAALLVYLYKKKKFEQDLELMLWKLKFDDIEFISRKKGVGSQTAFSHSSLMSDVTAHAHDNAELRVAYFRGVLVSVRLLQKTGILLTRGDHLELKIMRDINHENLNGFVGACVDPPNLCIVTKFCSKGSLQDILENEDIKLDQNFKMSLISDIIMGMEYLHRSALKSHGRLKSTNCVVDGRWVLKITDWGLENLREHTHDDDNQKYKALMWTAPELLREMIMPPKGSQKGDVYSFAIILQEVIYRYPPFGTPESLLMVPKDLIGRVRNGETPPFRPALSSLPGADNQTHLIQLMKDCWSEEPSSRPDFFAIKTRFNAINKGKTFNIMDNMLRMMEKYASNLEEVINDRTRQLVEEKKKTDLLLYRMLPTPVADSLKLGTTVKPELFVHSSVYFSDIVSFTSMASESSPLEVVDFLNDLWTVFDDIIARYDVYKVETIGDAYMVASGIPVPNGIAHASEIASMSLDILSSVLTFKIRHRPDRQLEVRIGIHSGPVVAGVVGQTMPRFCLFGDTVNTASRMESTGEALRIHISQEAHDAISATHKGFIMSRRGVVDVKGKGMQTTFWLNGKEGYTRPLPKVSLASASDGYNEH